MSVSSIPNPLMAARPHPRRRAQRRGIALVMVLAAITMLTVILVEFQDESSADVSGALTDRDAVKAEYIARSGVALARLLIAAEPTIRAPIAALLGMLRMPVKQIPVWQFSDRVLGAFNDAEGEQSFMSLANVDLSKGKNLGLDGGRFEMIIVDEDSKINVNIAARTEPISRDRLAFELLGLMAGDQYKLLFEQRDRDGQFSDRATICSAIVDWADFDEIAYGCDPTGASMASATGGTEDAFYQMIDPPYRRKNAGYDSLEELRLVRGIGDDFWATFVEPDPENPKKRTLSVWGQGTININTANPQTLLALVCANTSPQQPAGVCFDPLQMQKFLMVFNMVQGFTMGLPLFGSPKDFIAMMKGGGMFGPLLTTLGVQPVQFLSETRAMDMMSTESKVFSIYSDGVVRGFKRETRMRIHAVVDFRDAPPPGYGQPYAPPGASGSATSGQFSGPPAMPTATGGVTPFTNPNPDSILGALRPSTGGTVIYYRIE